MKKKPKTDFAMAYEAARFVCDAEGLLAAFRAEITTINSRIGGRKAVLGYNIRRDRKLIAGPFVNKIDAAEWAFLAYGPRE